MKPQLVWLLAGFFLSLPFFAEQTEAQPAGALSEKLDAIVLPSVEFREANIKDVLHFLVEAARSYDPEKKGVNILLLDAENDTRLTLSLKQVSLHNILKYVSELASLSLDIEEQAVVLRKPKVRE